jgi:hypothetical protein
VSILGIESVPLFELLCERQMRIHRIGGILPPACGKMPQIQRVYSHLPLALATEVLLCHHPHPWFS